MERQGTRKQPEDKRKGNSYDATLEFMSFQLEECRQNGDMGGMLYWKELLKEAMR